MKGLFMAVLWVTGQAGSSATIPRHPLSVRGNLVEIVLNGNPGNWALGMTRDTENYVRVGRLSTANGRLSGIAEWSNLRVNANKIQVDGIGNDGLMLMIGLEAPAAITITNQGKTLFAGRFDDSLLVHNGAALPDKVDSNGLAVIGALLRPESPTVFRNHGQLVRTTKGAAMISGPHLKGNLDRYVKPDPYPGHDGVVTGTLTIDGQGNVVDASLASLPELQQRAEVAVRSWKFRPFIIDGQPQTVAAPIVIIFQHGTVRTSLD